MGQIHYRVRALVDGSFEERFVLAELPETAMKRFSAEKTEAGEAFSEYPIQVISVHSALLGEQGPKFADQTYLIDSSWSRVSFSDALKYSYGPASGVKVSLIVLDSGDSGVFVDGQLVYAINHGEFGTIPVDLAHSLATALKCEVDRIEVPDTSKNNLTWNEIYQQAGVAS